MVSTLTFLDEHRQLRESCGYFPVDNRCLVRAQGKETFSFLQTQVTNDVIQLKVEEGQDNALTDRKARLLANFSLHKESEDSALLLVEKSQKEILIETLETYHFREDIHFEEPEDLGALLAIQGPKSALLLERLTGKIYSLLKPNMLVPAQVDGHDVRVLCKSLTGDDGYFLAFQPSLTEPITTRVLETGSEFGILPIREETQDILRVEAGIPVFGRDMNSSQILPETGLEHTSVSYHKGCYIGQEVIARVKTYGAPAFALMGLIWDGEELPDFDGEIKMQNRKIGTVKSSLFSPSLDKVISLAYIQKEYRSPDQTYSVTVNGAPREARTTLLPFYQPMARSDRARELHQQALGIFKDEVDLETPIALLREAIALDPKFAEGYEALGVMLSKQNKLDEAIALMKRLAEIDPQEIMAHTNLSIYYMQQGRIEEAELEKAEATAIQFEKLVEESQAQKARETKAQEDREEQKRQIGMFLEVLEIDPIDQVANFGLGSIYLDQERFSEALPPLRRVVENYPDYSAAYLILGKTLEKLEQKEDAAEVYRKGIATASKKGDLMPLREMQTRLNQIAQTSS